MPTYTIGIKVNAGVAPGAPICALRATTRRARVKEIRILAADTTQTEVALGVPNPAQSPPPAPTGGGTAPNPRDPEDAAATLRVDTAWGTPPAAPAGAYNRREIVAGVIGQGLWWPFQDPEVVPIPSVVVGALAPGQIVLYNVGGGAAGALDINLTLEE